MLPESVILSDAKDPALPSTVPASEVNKDIRFGNGLKGAELPLRALNPE
jgi:hypothetical protein